MNLTYYRLVKLQIVPAIPCFLFRAMINVSNVILVEHDIVTWVTHTHTNYQSHHEVSHWKKYFTFLYYVNVYFCGTCIPPHFKSYRTNKDGYIILKVSNVCVCLH